MKKIVKRISTAFILLGLFGYAYLLALPKPVLLDKDNSSRAVYDDKQHLLRLTLSKDEKFRLYTPLTAISQQLIQATLLQEDQYFPYHFGVNPLAMGKAIWQTYVLQSRRVGASTITMQLARMRYGFNSKKISGKLKQIVKALQIEMHYSKDEILEAYLNLAPYGGNIEGVEAASQIYFNTSSDKLTLPQALTLSVIPQNPGKRTPNNQELQSIRDHLLKRWLAIHPEDKNKQMMFSLPLDMRNRQHLPFKAPHLTYSVLHDTKNKSQNIYTTLDSATQSIIEGITRHYIERKHYLGVYNGAVLLVDTRSMEVKSLVGSVDFFNKHIAGQINGVETKRSPGSTLKPFIYGLALDQGLIHPNTVLKDVPHSFNGYNPENFDYDFMGPIKAKDALILSRNIPAIALANQLKPGLHQLLAQAQIAHLRPESYYGLSLSLGGVELTMHELVGLYALLVNEGVWRPITMLQGSQEQKKYIPQKEQGIRLLSREASFLILDMLKETPSSSVTSFPVAWKTGTSSGYRDAWTVGVFGPYVLAVWIGNFDNKANPAFVGKNIAAPLFFELINAMKQQGSLAFVQKEPQALHLERVQVCKVSGMLPTRYCSDREWTWFIPGISPIKTDTVFREIAINNKTGLRTCHINKDTRFEIFEFWPSDLLSIFKKAGIQRKIPPFFEADCALSGTKGISPHIISPQSGVQYIMSTQSHGTDEIVLSAVIDAGVADVYWFINENFIAKAKAGSSVSWHAKPGTYVVRVLDDHGLSDARAIKVLMGG